jgi:endosialidase-like protein
MAFWDSVKDFGKGMVIGGPIAGAINAGTGGSLWNSTLGNDPGADAERKRKEQLYGQAGEAGQFAGQAQSGYGQLGQRASGALDYLQGQAQGQNSVSAEQLRQGLQQNLAAQQSMAASASPQNAAMAARTAMLQSGRLGAGLAGQQAVAGLQERNQAQQQYAQLLEALRQQELQAALQSRQAAMGGYGAANAGTPEKSWIEKWGPAIQGGISAASAASDRRLKKDIKDGDDLANKAVSGLAAHLYKYKDEQYGKGQRLGIMAQDLERAGLGHAVIDTPQGKMVHGAHLATANSAMIGALGRRLAKLEDSK